MPTASMITSTSWARLVQATSVTSLPSCQAFLIFRSPWSVAESGAPAIHVTALKDLLLRWNDGGRYMYLQRVYTQPTWRGWGAGPVRAESETESGSASHDDEATADDLTMKAGCAKILI